MSDIEIGSKWRNTSAGSTSVVLAVVKDSAGRGRIVVERAYGPVETSVMVVSSEYFLRINEPAPTFFEVNATYKFRASLSELRYFIVGVRNFKGQSYAIAERTGSSSVDDRIVVLDDFAGFEEV